MRKFQQKQILDLLQKINQAQACGLYADCQKAVSTIYDFLEHTEGEGTRIAALLKDYYEALFKANKGEISKKQLKKLLIQIENGIKFEKILTFELLFLPYKYSMSDSLESIWIAALDKSCCKVNICPIPYYDKLRNGQLGEMHYEGHLYDKSLPLVDWQEYDIETIKPDIIFVHNPYDEKNYVTTVHPDFYCKRLRDMTQRLVFVPYAVSSKSEVGKIFSIIPGTIYSHKVISQSETIRHNYINYFYNYIKNNNIKNTFSEVKDKFCALGSPKFDKAVSVKREHYIFPKNWTSKLFCHDGTQKKVVLFNSSINALLTNNHRFIDTLKITLQKFKKHDDLVFIWRPHPLLRSTCEAMTPHLLYSYDKLVNDFKNDGWGIFDDSEDFYQAFAFSDAYFGDWSSLATLFQCVGKPVAVKSYNEKCHPFNKELQLHFVHLCIKGKVIYAYNIRTDSIFEINLLEKKTRLLTLLPHPTDSIGSSYAGMTIKGNLLILPPKKAELGVHYNLDTHECHSLSDKSDLVPKVFLVSSLFQDCFSQIQVNGFFWWCDRKGNLFKLNSKTKENVLICNISDNFYLNSDKNSLFILGYAGKFLYVLPFKYFPAIDNKAFKVDVESDTITECSDLTIKSNSNPDFDSRTDLFGYRGICMDENGCMYTYSYPENAVVCIDPTEEKIHKIFVMIDIDSIIQYLKSYVYVTPSFDLDNYLFLLKKNVDKSNNEEVKKYSLAVDYAFRQIVSRFFRSGEPDIGIHDQDGRNGQRILEAMLKEL